MGGWLWLLRTFGIRRTIQYWNLGRRDGWWPKHRVEYVKRILKHMEQGDR